MKNMEINDGHYLELMDRLHVIMCTLNEHCLEHPLAQNDEDIKFHIDYALGQLADAYQIVGRKSIDYENKNNTHK
jgi:formyltetrahydrofolate hydrolase